MARYSPYDNIRRQAYPNILATAGLHDSQVQYWEPAKWVAKLRRLKTNDALVLLFTEMDAGHGGASGRYEALAQTALEYSFLLFLEGKGKRRRVLRKTARVRGRATEKRAGPRKLQKRQNKSAATTCL